MRDETAEWLNPLLAEAEERGIDITPIVRRSMMPTAEADSPQINELAALTPDLRAVDWVQVGRLLCSELGWADTYPAFPDFPESRGEL